MPRHQRREGSVAPLASRRFPLHAAVRVALSVGLSFCGAPLWCSAPVGAAAGRFVGHTGESFGILEVPECCRLCPQGFETGGGRLQQVRPSTKAYKGLPKAPSTLLLETDTRVSRGVYDRKINDMNKQEMCYRKGSDQTRLAEMHSLLPCCPVCTAQFTPMPFDYEFQSPNAFYLSNLLEVDATTGQGRRGQSPGSSLYRYRKKGFRPQAAPLAPRLLLEATWAATGSSSSSSSSSFLQESFSPTLRFPTDTSKGGCCTVCDRDDEAQYPKTLGEKVYHPKMYPAFVQVGAEAAAHGRLSKSAKTGYSILDDGCCNTCTGNDLEPPEQRYSEPHGGPFGLLPRLEGLHVQGLVDRTGQGQDLTELCLAVAKKYASAKVDQDMAHAQPIHSGM